MRAASYELCLRIGFLSLLWSPVAVLTGCGGVTIPKVNVSVSGEGEVRVGASVQFTATVANSVDTKVNWQVNGAPGGSSVYGTISSGGLYVAPGLLPSPSTVNITAVSEAVPGVSGSQPEQLLNPVPVLNAATAVITAPNPNALLDVKGLEFVAGAQIQVAGVSVSTTQISPNELQAEVSPSPGLTALSVSVANPDPGASSTVPVMVNIQSFLASTTSASRLLDQATFGPTLTDIKHVQSVGLEAYLDEQLSTPATLIPDVLNPVPPPAWPLPPSHASTPSGGRQL